MSLTTIRSVLVRALNEAGYLSATMHLDGSIDLADMDADGAEVYVTVSLDKPEKTSSEVVELTAMDAVLKRLMFDASDAESGLSAKDIKDIIGERRQIQKQLGSLRASLNAADASGARGKLNDLKRRPGAAG